LFLALDPIERPLQEAFSRQQAQTRAMLLYDCVG
jgi:hypothetical protein